MSDFTLHSIGVILDRLNKQTILPQFVDNLFVNGRIRLVTNPPESMIHVVTVMERFGLDFDDAYQYIAAERLDATIVSFDQDFDRTDCGRQTPAMLLSSGHDQ